MDSNDVDKPCRGAYRTKQRVPRQTVFSKKKHNAESYETPESIVSYTEDLPAIDSSVCANASSGATVPPSSLEVCERSDVNDDVIDHADNDVTDSIDDDVTDDVDNCNGDEMNNFNNDAAENNASLCDGTVSPETSHLLVSSYMCRHHLTIQAREDLLKLLQLHLPVNNGLPSTLHILNKYADHTVDITPTSYYYCSDCYSILPGNKTSTCPNETCQTTLKESKDYFITVSVSKQLQILMKS